MVKLNAKSGDNVRIITKDEKYEGLLIPRPDLLNDDFVVLKLDNGYNIGIENKKIKKVEILKKYQKESSKGKKKTKVDKNLPIVSILSFGGTIASRIDYKTGGVSADYTAEDFVEMIPELGKVANLRAKNVMSIMSEDMNPEDWQIMAKAVVKELNDKDVGGVVISQGTDTLHYSSAALSFFLQNLNKPVIITAAQKSIDRGSSDAYLNLYCAVVAAAKLDGAVVATCMHGTSSDDYCLLVRGTKVKKLHTSRRDAFRSIGEEALAKIFENGKIEILNKHFERKSDVKVDVVNGFESKTGLLYVYPGMDPGILDYYSEKKYKGLVIAATALGHVPTVNEKYSLLNKIKKLIKDGCAVVISTQTTYGRVHPYVYTNLRKLSIQLECIYVEDMMPEVAYAKLGWVLAQSKGMKEIKEKMLNNYAGEITERSDSKSFLS
tara:strand:- start:465 stop:1772 length:1308 start_codon:yes stop_codon:yes gene_type:complete